jgi:5-methylcytosine-specific restriction endonuclease McrA
MRKLKLASTPYCEECGSMHGLCVHHIIPLAEGGERLDIENLMTLCRECHDRKHGRIK